VKTNRRHRATSTEGVLFVSHIPHRFAKSILLFTVLLMTVACESNRGPEVRIIAQKTPSVGGNSNLEEALEMYDTFFFFGGTLVGKHYLGELDEESLEEKVLNTLVDAGFQEAPDYEVADVAVFAYYGVGLMKDLRLDTDNPGIGYVVPGQEGEDISVKQVKRVLPDFDGGLGPKHSDELGSTEYLTDRYFIQITAYDLEKYVNEFDRQRIWQTIISVPYEATTFSGVFDHLLTAAKPYLGRDLDHEIAFHLPGVGIEVGNVDVIGFEESSGQGGDSRNSKEGSQ